jgi:hypothetical protein
MKILFDQGTPVPLRRHLHPHSIDTASELGWSRVENGELISLAEQHGYQIIITTDQNLKYQQNLQNRVISILVLMSTSWPRIRQQVESIQKALLAMDSDGHYVEVAS